MENNDKDSSNGNGLKLGEIGMIRNILMGEQINDFEEKFNIVQDQIRQLEQQLNEKIDALGNTTEASFSKMEKSNQSHFEEIEKQLIANVEKLNNRIDKVSTADKMRLGKMLDKVSKQLMGE